jgi:hypothetical protein
MGTWMQINVLIGYQISDHLVGGLHSGFEKHQTDIPQETISMWKPSVTCFSTRLLRLRRHRVILTVMN